MEKIGDITKREREGELGMDLVKGRERKESLGRQLKGERIV